VRRLQRVSVLTTWRTIVGVKFCTVNYCTCTHTCIHTRTHTHTYTHTCTQVMDCGSQIWSTPPVDHGQVPCGREDCAWVFDGEQALTHTHVHTYTCTRTRTHIRTRTRTHTCTYDQLVHAILCLWAAPSLVAHSVAFICRDMLTTLERVRDCFGQ
jgi:hypothetical protein